MQAKATINERGLIAIPAAMWQGLGLEPSDEVLIEQTEQGLLIRPVWSGLLEIYAEKRIAGSPTVTPRSARPTGGASLIHARAAGE